jgi:hypothetical protein
VARSRLGRLALWTLAALLFGALDFVRIEGVQHPAVQWVLLRVGTQEAESALVPNNLFEARSLKCTWGHGVTAKLAGSVKESLWTTLLRPLGVVPRVAWGPGNTSHFDAINIQAGSARFIGNQGAGPIPLQATASGLTFYETTDFGNISTTTIFATPVRDGYYPAVISRHMDFLGEVVVSQYTGSCVALPTDG